MNLYTAAVFSNNYMRGQARYEKLTGVEKDIVHNLPNILESWHYVGKQKFIDEMRNEHAQIFLDSGAYSAYTLGVELSVKDYVDYINFNKDIIRHEDGVMMASVLDGIGDPLQTYRNQLEMEQLGVKPLPCFHAGEDERYLEWYVANYEYITLGGMVGSSTQQLTIWLDRIWDRYLTDGSGHAKLKVHGFGITAIPLMKRYPWYSCDSSSWIQAAAFGAIVMPKYGPVRVSEKSPARHDPGQHLGSLTQIEQDHIFRLLEEQGFTYERLSKVYESRAAYNLWAFKVIGEVMRAQADPKFKAHIQELF